MLRATGIAIPPKSAPNPLAGCRPKITSRAPPSGCTGSPTAWGCLVGYKCAFHTPHRSIVSAIAFLCCSTSAWLWWYGAVAFKIILNPLSRVHVCLGCIYWLNIVPRASSGPKNEEICNCIQSSWSSTLAPRPATQHSQQDAHGRTTGANSRGLGVTIITCG